MNTPTAQDATIARLERAGFRFSNWFRACDPENPDARRALLKKRMSSFGSFCAEVDPDGSVNGQSVDAFLSSLSR